MIEKEILNEIIIGYRKIIDARYDFSKLKEKIELPDSFTESQLFQIKNYFLHYIYPPPQKREALDEAFDSLDSYIKNPEKLLRILMLSSRLIFKYGRHLPKILKAGIKALKSFRTANNFEQNLVEAAIELQLNPPYDKSNIETLINQLSASKLDKFIEDSQSLFEILQDRVLVKKILEIVNYLISKMQKRPDLYSEIEINGLKIGRDIIQMGDEIFAQLSANEQKMIFNVIVAIETNYLEGIRR